MTVLGIGTPGHSGQLLNHEREHPLRIGHARQQDCFRTDNAQISGVVGIHQSGAGDGKLTACHEVSFALARMVWARP